MTSTWLLLVTLAADASALSGADLEAYRSAAKGAGRDASAHIRLALWCEAHGLSAERLEHLAVAVAIDPANTSARGLMGLVPDGDRWVKAERVVERARSDPKLAATLSEYADRRAKADRTADDQWKLALWCEGAGLSDEARAHLAAVVRIDPAREAAWKRLGCKKVGRRWLSPEQIARQKAEADAQQVADRRWKERLDRIRGELKLPSRRAEAEAALAAISDPRAVPALLRAFCTGRAADLARLVQVLGQTGGRPASQALALVALRADDAEIRRAAGETLRRRDPREFADLLIAAIRPEIKYQVQPSEGPGSPAVLMVEGERYDRRRIYATPPMPTFAAGPFDSYATDDEGLPVLLRYQGDAAQGQMLNFMSSDGLRATIRDADRPLWKSDRPEARFFNSAISSLRRRAAQSELDRLFGSSDAGFIETNISRHDAIPVGQMAREARNAAAAAQAQLDGDVAAIEAHNRSARAATERATDVLRAVSGQDFGTDRASWSRWSTDLRGYAFVAPASRVRQVVDEVVPPAYAPGVTPIVPVHGLAYERIVRHACFGAGTPVRTRSGDRPIETVSAGDLVLTQDARDGSLRFQPVVAVYHNPPSPTLKVTIGEGAVIVTGIHRLWKAGHGWVMARDLETGDPIRTAGGIARVGSIVEDRVQPVFNLEVASGRSFFAGSVAALVHDNSLVESISTPFDAVGPATAPKDGPR